MASVDAGLGRSAPFVPPALEPWHKHLPRRPYCSDDYSRGVYIRPQDEALRAAFIQYQTPRLAAHIVLDVDTPHAGAAWLDNDAPAPNLIVTNPKNGHAKLVYTLKAPVAMSDRARRAPQEMFHRAERGLAELVGADMNFGGGVATTNNPTHSAWSVLSATAQTYELGELLEYLPAAPKRVERGELVGDGRNCTVFHELRLWAYPLARAAKERGEYSTWLAALRRQAQLLNSGFMCPMPDRETARIAQSVAEWTWRNAHKFSGAKIGGVKRSKVKQSSQREPMTPEQARERMRAGRAYSAQVQRNASRDRIIQAIGQLAAEGQQAPSKAQIAARAGVSIDTVKRFRREQKADMGGN